jgi:Uma2 family endonuclease
MVIPMLELPQGQWTYRDWEAMPNDKNGYEVIDGSLYMSMLPSLYHQWIVGQLLQYVAISSKLYSFGFHYVGVILSNLTVITPDFVFIKTENAGIMTNRRIRGVPDLIAEVLSPGNRDYDEDVKLTAYAKAGVPEYAVIDAWKKQLRLYFQPMDGEYSSLKKFSADHKLTFACLPEVILTVGDLFSGAPDESL